MVEKVDELKTFNDVIKLVQTIIRLAEKEVKKLKNYKTLIITY